MLLFHNVITNAHQLDKDLMTFFVFKRIWVLCIKVATKERSSSAWKVKGRDRLNQNPESNYQGQHLNI